MDNQTQKVEKERVVVCMKWGALYPSSYVNVLYSAVKKNLTGSFRFVCLTNEPEGLDEGIESYPIPDIGLPTERYGHGAWPKLVMFKKDLYGLTGRCLFIDLDTIICGNLDPFFDVKGAFVAIGLTSTWVGKKKPRIYKKWKAYRASRKPSKLGAPDTPAPSTMGTGIFCFDLGTQSHIYDAALANWPDAFATFGNEQELVEHYLESWEAWDSEWVISFKLHLRRPILIDLFLPPKEPAPHIPVVAFHGDPRPIDLVHRGHSSARELPHFWRGPVKWVHKYWVDNGYQG